MHIKLALLFAVYLAGIFWGDSSIAGDRVVPRSTNCNLKKLAATSELDNEFSKRLDAKFGNTERKGINRAERAFESLSNGKKLTPVLLEDLTNFRFEFKKSNVSLEQISKYLKEITRILRKNNGLSKTGLSLTQIRNIFHRQYFYLWADLVPRREVEELLEVLTDVEANKDPYIHTYLTSMDLLLEILPNNSPIWKKISHQIVNSRTALRLAPIYDKLPKSIRDEMSKNWMTTDTIPAQKLKNIRIINKVDHQKIKYCGACPFMRVNHVEGLEHFSQDGLDQSISLIYVGDVLVGSLKYIGHPSMLALNNIEDANGNLIIAAGMTYHLPHDFFNNMNQSRVIILPKDYNFEIGPNYAVRNNGGKSFQEEILKLRQLALKGRRLKNPWGNVKHFSVKAD